MSIRSVLLITILFPICGEKNINSTLIDKGVFIISFDNGTMQKFKIRKESGLKYFYMKNDTGDSSKTFFDVDLKAKPRENIDSLLKEKTIRPKLTIGEPLPILYMVYIVDQKGNAIYQGLDREWPIKDYQDEFSRLMKEIHVDFFPAQIKDKPVSSVVKINVDYYKLFD